MSWKDCIQRCGRDSRNISAPVERIEMCERINWKDQKQCGKKLARKNWRAPPGPYCRPIILMTSEASSHPMFNYRSRLGNRPLRHDVFGLSW
jgi:hypothetical protein